MNINSKVLEAGDNAIVVVSVVGSRQVQKKDAELRKRDDDGFETKARNYGVEAYYVMPRDKAVELTDNCLFFSNVHSPAEQLITRLAEYEPVIVHTSHGTNFGYRESNGFFDNCRALRSVFGQDTPIYHFQSAHNSGTRYVVQRDDKWLISDFGMWQSVEPSDSPAGSRRQTISVFSPGVSNWEYVKTRLIPAAGDFRADAAKQFEAYLRMKPKRLGQNEDEDPFASLMKLNQPKEEDPIAKLDAEYKEESPWDMSQNEIVRVDDVYLWNSGMPRRKRQYRYTAEVDSLNSDPELESVETLVSDRPLSLKEIFDGMWPKSARKFGLNPNMETAHKEFEDKIGAIASGSGSDEEKAEQMAGLPFPRINAVWYGDPEDKILIVTTDKEYELATSRHMPCAQIGEEQQDGEARLNSYAQDKVLVKSVVMNEREVNGLSSPEMQKLFDGLCKFYRNDPEIGVEVLEDGVITVGFDGSGYDNGYYRRQGFEEQADGLQAFIDSWNKENGTDFDFDSNERDEYFEIAGPSETVNEKSVVDYDVPDISPHGKELIRNEFEKAGNKRYRFIAEVDDTLANGPYGYAAAGFDERPTYNEMYVALKLKADGMYGKYVKDENGDPVPGDFDEPVQLCLTEIYAECRDVQDGFVLVCLSDELRYFEPKTYLQCYKSQSSSEYEICRGGETEERKLKHKRRIAMAGEYRSGRRMKTDLFTGADIASAIKGIMNDFEYGSDDARGLVVKFTADCPSRSQREDMFDGNAEYMTVSGKKELPNSGKCAAIQLKKDTPRQHYRLSDFIQDMNSCDNKNIIFFNERGKAYQADQAMPFGGLGIVIYLSPFGESGVEESDSQADAYTGHFPAWALDYAVNAEVNSVSRHEKSLVDGWFRTMLEQGYDVGRISYGEDEYFSSSPEFGLPCDCVDVTVCKA